jgi:hypothetical protein
VTGELRRSRFPYQIVRMDVPSVANISSLIIDVYALLGVFNFADGVGHRPDDILASTREAGCMSVCAGCVLGTSRMQLPSCFPREACLGYVAEPLSLCVNGCCSSCVSASWA